MKIDLSRQVPPGLPLAHHGRLAAIGGAAAALYSGSFLFRYAAAYNALYIWSRGERKLVENAMMPSFIRLIDGAFLGFAVLAVCILAMVIYHYAYHYQGSKSIYLMRRLPSRWELHRRCWTLPVLELLGCLAGVLVLLLAYFAVYQCFTPTQCLMPGQWEIHWRAVFRIGSMMQGMEGIVC